MIRGKILYLIVIILSVLCVGCAVPPSDVTGQHFVDDTDFKTAVFVKEGLAYAQNQKFVDAEFAFLRAIYLSPDADIIRFNLAVVWLFQERYEEALNVLAELYEKDRLSPGYRIWYARALVSNNQYSAGLSLLIEGEEGALLKGDWPLASVYSQAEASVFFNAGYEEEALCASSRSYAQIQNPENVFNLARYLTALGHPESAKKIIKDFLTINFQAISKHIRYEEAILSYDSQSYDESINLAKETFILPPSDESIERKSKSILLLSEKKITMEALTEDQGNEVMRSLNEDLLYLPKSFLIELATFSQNNRSKGHIFSDLYHKAV